MLYTCTIYAQIPCGQGSCAACSIGAKTDYELIEWAAAEMMEDGADDFLGTQGYAWDTQSEMLTALIGAISLQGLLGKVQDKQLRGRAQ